MKKNRIIGIAVFALLATIAYYSFVDNDSAEKYAQQILNDRAEKDLFMKSNEGSPFVLDSVPFGPLKYFE
ncbi:MAG: hypothetical protein ACKOE6_13825, partial [Flammeovirgaceae bacterium]